MSIYRAKIVGIHPAPDLDTVATTAMACNQFGGLYKKSVEFIPAGILSPAETQKKKEQGIVLFDVGGLLGGYDHHGGKRNVSACRIVCERLRVQGRFLPDLLKFVDGNDRKGTNYRLKILFKGNEVVADDLLFSSVIRASSQVRYNPFKEISHEERERAFWRLVRIARIIINRTINPNLDQAPLSAAAGYLLRLSLCQAIAKSIGVTQSKFLTKGSGNRFTATLGHLNQLNDIADKAIPDLTDDDEAAEELFYRCQDDPRFADLINLMVNFPPKLHIYEGRVLQNDDLIRRFVINLSLLGLAQGLVENKQMKQNEKLAILKDCWLNLIARKEDWLLATSQLRGDDIIARTDVAGYHVVTVRSDCSSMGPATRHANNGINPKKANVSIIGRNPVDGKEFGHVQITCTPGDALKQLSKEAGFQLRIAEAQKRGLVIPEAELRQENILVAGWYVPDFGGALNGSLSDPIVEPTMLPLKEIHRIVCKTLGQTT